MRVALDFHGVSGGSKSARQGLSRHWSSSEMLQGVVGEGLHRRVVSIRCISKSGSGLGGERLGVGLVSFCLPFPSLFFMA
ncbi:hypothetical protein YC2023_019638 [Brassica napus]